METLFTSKNLSIKGVMEKMQLVRQVRSEFENPKELKLTIVLALLIFQVIDASYKIETIFKGTIVQA